MFDKLTKYKNLDYQIPDEYLAWRLYEAGVENFGVNGPDKLQMPKPGPNELLTRIDAIGICFSDVKLITQGPGHPRITGRDLKNDPVIAGHEVSLTIIEAGANYVDKYHPGEKYIVQADIFFKGVSMAYGYVLPGAMQQYGIVGEPVLNGDEGSYLIPVKQETGYAEAALVEPWGCVIAAYRIKPRKNLQPGGTTLIVGTDDKDYSIDSDVCAGGPPAKIILAGVTERLKTTICKCGGCKAEVIEIAHLTADNVKALSDERTGGKGFDDVIILGTPEPELVEALSTHLAARAIMAICSDKPLARDVSIDIGRVHYDYIDYIGTCSTRVLDAYSNSRDSELKPGGTAWFVGAGGPMGQMHVQRAVAMSNGPKKILCTDVDTERLNYLKASVADDAKRNEVDIMFLNPVEAGTDSQKKAVDNMTSGKGFDDIVMLAPVPALISGLVKFLARGGLMNIFAGVPRGTITTMDLNTTFLKGGRFVGSSGSRPQDMIDVLNLTESGELPTRNSLAAIGGIDAMPDGVKAVKDARFPGKTVIFPHIKLPLTALPDLRNIAPSVYAKLKDGHFWTKEAEDELLENKLEL